MAKLDKLITYAYLKEETDLPTNLPDEELEHPIYRGQEMLRMLMGDGFYQDFVTKYKASTFNTAETSLYAYLKQFVAWQAYEFWTTTANLKKTRAGFRVHTETNSTVADEKQMAVVIRDAKTQAQYYKKLMVDFLNNHCADYPLYDCNCRDDKTGNGFHISAVKNKNKQPEPYGHRRTCCE